jgi:hypothetical protein
MRRGRQDQSAALLCSWRLTKAAIATALLITTAEIDSAFAHGSERGFVLLLPTGYYLIGGALAVAASFVLIALVPAALAERLGRARLKLGTLPAINPAPTSFAAFLFLLLLLAAGLYGTRDPLENLLPLTIWTVWWVGMTLLHTVVGNLWTFINPWTGPYWLLDRLAGRWIGRVGYPEKLSYWPAVILFFGFAWFELVDPAPDDPERLAVAVGIYWLLAFFGMLVFGHKAWTERAEPFSIFFRLIGGLSPLIVEMTDSGRFNASLGWPGSSLLDREALPLSGIVFVLLTLSSVSFDGLSRTYWCLALGGINPLEYPGRTALIHRNSAGLVLALAALAILYWAAVRLGWILGGMRTALKPALGSLVYSIIPISIAFHFSHYLTVLLVNGQYALIAASDPFGTGLDLLGLSHAHVTTSFLNVFESVRLIWNVQTAGIVIGHIVGIVLAHLIALRHFGGSGSVERSQVPLAVLMVFYTLFGLWLLSTPSL